MGKQPGARREILDLFGVDVSDDGKCGLVAAPSVERTAIPHGESHAMIGRLGKLHRSLVQRVGFFVSATQLARSGEQSKQRSIPADHRLRKRKKRFLDRVDHSAQL